MPRRPREAYLLSRDKTLSSLTLFRLFFLFAIFVPFCFKVLSFSFFFYSVGVSSKEYSAMAALGFSKIIKPTNFLITDTHR